MTRAEELAETHLEWVRGLLESTGVEQKIIDACAYVYITSFIHGYKHALQDNEKLAELKSLLAESGGLGDK